MITKVQNNDGQLDQLQSVIDQVNENLGYDINVTRKPAGGTWQPAAATSGTDTACTNGTVYVGRVRVDAPCRVTGIQNLVGSVGGTDKVIVTLYNESGALLRASAAAGATVGTAANAQQVAFALNAAGAAATTIDLEPGYYWIGLTFNGTTAKFRSVPAHCQVGTNVLGNGLTQTFGTIATSITPPTTFTADKVPVASLY
jgi:hypothetical protein